ncbi:hypothetical protein [Streptomyces sp. NRRL F-5630]|uniref:hypothetical protein n=1 Tax=Streptomyces sp. NRRL F-5630 TaxID=1463864 RepID=UPI00131CB2EB|nr:hypothetical protein [Streptomyces sp. NRRL F-5630]
MSDSRWVRIKDANTDPERRTVDFKDLSTVTAITIRQIPANTGIAPGFYVEFEGVRTLGPYPTYDAAEDLVAALIAPYFPDLPA